ncbi:MAG: metallophosphoesterase family protein [Planctomycetota bacterium]|nr:metallophosphoesterase family protein [Planctomycetota bacterium]
MRSSVKTAEILRQNDSITSDERRELEALREAVRRFSAARRCYVVPEKNGEAIFAVCADLHVGSQQERSDALAEFFAICDRAKVSRIFIAGDILDGCHVYRGHEYDIRVHGLERQLDELARVPKTKCRVDFICGNHDLSFFKACGAPVGQLIAERTGWTWCGDEYADIMFIARRRTFYLALSHPSGTGTAYAISYRPQKIAESITGGRKPHVLVIGHYHKSEFLPSYRNIAILQAGCFQSQTR